MAHSFDLPFPAMRYTAYSTWRASKNQFRKIYYEGGDIPQTPQVVFGAKCADEWHADPNIPGTETELTATLRTRGNKFLTIQGHLDQFLEDERKIREFKTGHLNPKGKPPWDKLKVRRHVQLPFYSLLVKELYGEVDPYVELIWLETEWERNTEEFEGHILEGGGDKLRLTGHQETFVRRIAEWERKKLKKELFIAAKEIEDDFRQYTERSEGIFIPDTARGARTKTHAQGTL